ncbi:hypothetical protein HK405_012938, partial [Cladochytrium tenue]
MPPTTAPSPSPAPPSPQPPQPQPRWYRPGHAVDLAVGLVLVVFALLADRLLQPFERPFDTTDPDLAHPHLPDIVTNAQLGVVSVVFPLATAAVANAVMVAVTVVTPPPAGGGRAYARASRMRAAVRGAVRSWHHFLITLVLAIGITGLFTNLVKNWAGRLRPDFLDRCQYNATLGVCTGDSALVTDGRRSFPSGHSSLSFVACTLLTLHLLSVLGVLGHGGSGRTAAADDEAGLPFSRQDSELRPMLGAADGSAGSVAETAAARAAPPERIREPVPYPVTGKAWRIGVSVLPLLVALYVGIS